jgi:hypothetical protein
MRKLIASYNTSPRMVHSVLLPFNYRRNLRMAIQHGGLPAEYGGFYSQYQLEDLQELTAGWWPEPLYPRWLSVSNFADTGERTGLVASIDAPDLDRIQPAVPFSYEQLTFAAAGASAGEATDGEAADGDALSALPATASVRFYAHMQGLTGQHFPITAVITAAEKAKFGKEWMRHVGVQVRTPRRQATAMHERK